MLFDQLFCVLSSVHPFCKRKPFVNQGLCVVGTQSVSVGLCNNGCVVKLISSNTLSHPEIVLTRKAAVAWTLYGVAKTTKCKSKYWLTPALQTWDGYFMLCVCLFAFVCLFLGYISSFSDRVQSLTTLLSELLLCCSLFSAPTLSFPLSSTGMSNITN